MKKFTIPRNAKIVVRPGHPALKIALTVLIVFSMAALIALSWAHSAITAETEALRDEAAAVEYANTKMEERIQNPDSIDNVLAIAKEELGLVDPKTIVIEPKGPSGSGVPKN